MEPVPAALNPKNSSKILRCNSALSVVFELCQGHTKVKEWTVEEDGDKGMSGTTVGDDLLGKENVVDNFLVLDIQLLVFNNLPPASPVIYPSEEKDSSITLASFH